MTETQQFGSPTDDTTDDHFAMCPKCVRIVQKDRFSDAKELVESHNQSQHDGQNIARAVGPYREDLNEFIDYVRDAFGDTVRDQMFDHIIESDPYNIR
jgi:phosphopantetheine adenylyltransferase